MEVLEKFCLQGPGFSLLRVDVMRACEFEAHRLTIGTFIITYTLLGVPYYK